MVSGLSWLTRFPEIMFAITTAIFQKLQILKKESE